jgi:hypothetical protein
LISIYGSLARHLEEPRCWIRSPRRPARLFRGGRSGATLGAQRESLAADSPAKRRAEPQAVDSTRSGTPTRRGKALKPASKRAESAPCPSFCEVALAIWRSHGAGFVLLPRRRVFEWRDSGAQIPGTEPSRASPSRHPIRRAEPQAVDSNRSSTPTRREKASKPAAKGADSAPCTSV